MREGGTMFDIGFSELIVVGIVALIVIGPERLPKVARTAGHLMGRLRRYVSEVKSDISREMQMEELHKLHGNFRDAAEQVKQSVTTQATAVEHQVKAMADGMHLPDDHLEPAPYVPEHSPQLELGLENNANQPKPLQEK